VSEFDFYLFIIFTFFCFPSTLHPPFVLGSFAN